MVSKLYSWMWDWKNQLPSIKPSQCPPVYLHLLLCILYPLTCTAAAPPRSPARPGSPSASPAPGLAIISTVRISIATLLPWECREPSCKRSPFQSDLSNLWFHLICSAAPAIQKLRYNSINLVFSSEIQVFEILMGSAILHFCQRRDNIYLIPAPKWSSAS